MQHTANADLKEAVKAHWESEVCGVRYAGNSKADRESFFAEVDRARYGQNYMLADFARFDEARGKRVLEIGTGAGSDFIRWARAGAQVHGRDLTEASINIVKERLALEGLTADIARGDAENLEFPDNYFDLYYSWGVLHHTPDTEKAITEAHRVLKPGGRLKIMMYHYPNLGAYVVWLVHGPLRLKWKSPRACYFENVESPGTKMYTLKEAQSLIARVFGSGCVAIETYLTTTDLLQHELSSKYTGRKWKILQALYPRWLLKRIFGNRFGTVMTIAVTKAS